MGRDSLGNKHLIVKGSLTIAGSHLYVGSIYVEGDLILGDNLTALQVGSMLVQGTTKKVLDKHDKT